MEQDKIKSFFVDGNAIQEQMVLGGHYSFLLIEDKNLSNQFIVGERIYIQKIYLTTSESTLRTVLATDFGNNGGGDYLIIWLKRDRYIIYE